MFNEIFFMYLFDTVAITMMTNKLKIVAPNCKLKKIVCIYNPSAGFRRRTILQFLGYMRPFVYSLGASPDQAICPNLNHIIVLLYGKHEFELLWKPETTTTIKLQNTCLNKDVWYLVLF